VLPSSFEFLNGCRHALDHGVCAGAVKGTGKAVTFSEAQRSVHTYLCGVSGSGKSRFLQSLICQDVAKGHPVCVLDPMGDLYDRIREFVATCLERAGDRGFARRQLLPQYLFLNAADPANPIRLNPLEPSGDETSEQQVDDLMKALERLLGASLEEQRKLRNVLRGAFLMIAELNHLPPHLRPPLPKGQQVSYPLGMSFAVDLLNFSDRERLAIMAALPESTRLHFRRQYWEFFALSSPAHKHLIVQSSWNAFQYLLDDSLVLNVLADGRSTVDLANVLREGRSLVCHLPLGENLAGARFLGKFLLTKLQHSAYRRPEGEWRRAYYLYLDEFQQWGDQAFADAMTNLRKFGLRVTNAHQSQTQPPFDTAEGQALLRTIKANSRIKVLFRLDRPDAEVLARELFEVTQRRANFEAEERAVGSSEQRSSSVGRSSMQTEGSGQASSYSQGRGRDAPADAIRWGSGQSNERGVSTGTKTTETTTVGKSKTVTSRTVYYTLEGERELLVNALQRIRDRECYVFTEALSGHLVEPLFVPDQLYCYTAENLPDAILEEQRRRLLQAGVVEQAGDGGGVVVPIRAPATKPIRVRRKDTESDTGARAVNSEMPWDF
jgi:hypothetical protein